MQGVDNESRYTNSDPDGHGVGQVPGGTDRNSPANGTDFSRQEDGNAPLNSQGGTTFSELAQKKGWQTPDDAAKSYAELEKQFHATRPVSRTEETRSTHVEQAVAPKGKLSLSESERLRKIEVRQELDDLMRSYPDMESYQSDILEKIDRNPGLPLEDAYWAAKGKRTEEEARNAGREEGRQEGESVAEAKIRAASAGSRARIEAQTAETIDEKIQGARNRKELEEVERMLPHA